MTIPYTFANATGTLPLQELDDNFANVYQYVLTAGNVVNNAQSNITSLGTLNALTVSGNTVTIGNVTGTFYFGNGVFLTGLYGNSNVANYLPGNPTILTLQNGLVAVNANVANTNANVSTLSNTVAAISSDSSGTANALANTNANVANTNSNVAALTSSLANTNANVANTNSNVATLTTGLANTNSNVANVYTSLTGVNSALSNTNSNVANTNSNVASTNSNVANVYTSLTGVNNTLTNAISNITTLQGQVYANSNLTAFLANTTIGITTTGNIRASNFIGNVVGNISGNLSAPGSNTQVLFNANGIVGASANLTFSDSQNQLTVGNVLTRQIASPTFANLVLLNSDAAGGFAQYYWTLSGAKLIMPTARGSDNVTGMFSPVSNLRLTANTANLTLDNTGVVTLPDGSVIDQGGLYGATTGVLGNATGDVQVYAQDSGVGLQTYNGNTYYTWTFNNSGNLSLPGNASTAGNITAGFYFGDGSQLSNISANSLVGGYGNSNVANYLPTDTTIINIQNSVSNTNSNVANVYASLTGVNSSLSNSISNTNSNVTALSSDLGNTNSNVANVYTSLTGVNSSLSNSISNTNSNVTALSSDLGNTNSNVANLTTSVTGVVNDLSNTNSNVANNSSNITSLFGLVYSNSNVATFMSNFGSNVISTTGDITATSVTATGEISVGNLYSPNFFSNAIAYANATGYVTTTSLFKYDPGTGVLTVDAASLTGNVTANYYFGDGSQLSNINAGNITGGYGNSNVAVFLADFGSNVISTSGNITSSNLNLDGGNIVQAQNNNLTIFVQDQDNDDWALNTAVTNGTDIMSSTILDRDQFRISTNLLANARTWTFDNTGDLSLPGNISGIEYSNTSIWARDDGTSGSVELKTISYQNDTLGSNVRVTQTNATISTANAAFTWTFDNTGSLTFPRDVAGNADPYLTIEGGEEPSITSTDVSQAGPANLSIVANFTKFSGYNGNTISIYADEGEIASQGQLQLWTNAGNIGNTSSWTFGTDGNLTLPDSTTITAAAIINLVSNSDGNISGLDLNGDADANLYAHSNVTILTGSNGAGNTWTFDNTGNLSAPGNIVASTFVSTEYNVLTAGNLSITSQYGLGVTGTILENGGTLELLANTSSGCVVVGWDSSYGNGLGPIATVNFNQVGGGEGNVLVSTGNRADTEYIWNFDNTGNLGLPGGGIIYGNPFTPSGSPGNTITLQPAGSGIITDQRLLIYPTAADGDHLHLATGNLYQTELFLGNDDFYVKLANTGNVVINSNNSAGNTAQSVFVADGSIITPPISIPSEGPTGEAQSLRGTRRIIGGLNAGYPYSQILDNNSGSIVAWVAENSNTTSARITFHITYTNSSFSFQAREMLTVDVVQDLNTGEAYYSVSGRMGTNGYVPGTVTASLNSQVITINIVPSGTYYYGLVVYDATEFKGPLD